MSLFQNAFQVLALAALAFSFILTLLAGLRGWISKRAGMVWMTVWVTAGVAILWPQMLSRIARLVGIGRGADLLLYCAVVVMLVGFLMVYVRLRRLRRELTLLVRALALRDADQDNLGSPEFATGDVDASSPPTES